MIWVALLRGINVGGKNKVEMSRLRTALEKAGLAGVRTYINTGNVIFGDDREAPELTPLLEDEIAAEFGFTVRVLLWKSDAVVALAEAIPESWKDDSTMRCYVMFLWQEADDPKVVDDLTIKEGIDDVVYLPGAVVWRVDRADLTRSGMMKVTGSDLYQSMTIRNCNTVRKLATIANEFGV